MERWLPPTVLSLMGLAACSGGEASLTLTVEPTSLVADGMGLSELTARVIFRGEAIPDGKDVLFRSTQPGLFASRETVAPEVDGGRRPGVTELEVESQAGRARAFFQAPIVAGPVTIEASFTTVNKDVLTDSFALEVGPPPLVSAGEGSLGNLVPHFDFWCDQGNVGGLVENRPEIRVNCHLTLKDASGRDLPHVPVRFFAEAGTIRDEPATAESPRRITYVIAPTPAQLPRDVTPWPPELGNNLVVTSQDPRFVEHNPTDGLVTLLAVVRGQEAFDDLDGDGVLDDNEAVVEEGEPFLDVDDDGAFTPSVDPEPCCDSNGNGIVDGFNGAWDQEVWLGRMTHILWTGAAQTAAPYGYVVPNPTEIAAQGNQAFTLFVGDRNFNPVATVDPEDSLELDKSDSKIGLAPETLLNGQVLSPTTGMFLNDRFPVFRFGLGDRATNPVFLNLAIQNGLLVGREWAFTLSDTRTLSAMCNGTTDAWSVTATIAYTIALDHSGGRFDRREAQLGASGTLGELTSGQPPCP